MTSGILDTAFNSLERIESGLIDQAYKILAEAQDQIIEINREKQLFEKGIDSKGKRLKEYSPYTKALKRQKGEVYNRTTLLDEGDFYDNFYLLEKPGGNLEFNLFSSDSKTEDLIAKYGKDIFGLTVENEQIVNIDITLPKLIEWILTQMKI